MTTNGALSRRDELKGLLARVLEDGLGVIVPVIGGESNARTLAITALNAAKRELVEHDKRYLDLVIKPMPYTKDKIAIYKQDQTHLEAE